MNSTISQRQRDRAVRLIVHILLIAGAVAMVAPFIWMVITSLKTNTEATQIPIKIFPSHMNWSSYSDAVRFLPFVSFYINTIVSAFLKTLGPLIFSSLAAFAFARIVFPGRQVLFIMLISVMMVPNAVFYTPQYFLLNKMHLVNTVTALFITGLVSPFATFLLRQFFKAIPVELEEAAQLDGCNPLQTFYHVMLPLVKSALVAVAIIHMLWSWNDLQWPLIINSSPNKLTLSSGLMTLQSQYATNYPVMMAGACMAIIPMIAFFMVFQKRFVEGLTFTANKG